MIQFSDFTVVGINRMTDSRVVFRVQAVDPQDAELQATRKCPQLRVAAVFDGHVEKVDTETSSAPQLKAAG
jgi:hypothetical protein